MIDKEMNNSPTIDNLIKLREYAINGGYPARPDEKITVESMSRLLEEDTYMDNVISKRKSND